MTIETENLMNEVRGHLATAEEYRRERVNMDANPLPGMVDYSGPAQAAALGMQHLDESIPNGQRVRTEQAYMAMKKGVDLLGLWLRAKGYRI